MASVVCRPVTDRQVSVFVERLLNEIPIHNFRSDSGCSGNTLYEILFASLNANYKEIFKVRSLLKNSKCKFDEWATPSLKHCLNNKGKGKGPSKQIELLVDNITISNDQYIANTFVNFFTNIPIENTRCLNSCVEKALSLITLLHQNVSCCNKVLSFSA